MEYVVSLRRNGMVRELLRYAPIERIRGDEDGCRGGFSIAGISTPAHMLDGEEEVRGGGAKPGARGAQQKAIYRLLPK